MSEYTLHFDPWNIRASDLADVMQKIKNAFKSPQGWDTYTEGTDGEKDEILLEYDNGNILFWLDYIDYEDVPRMLALLSPYDIRLVEVSMVESRASVEFDRFKLDHEFGRIVKKAREYMKETKDEVKAYEKVWEEFCTEYGLIEEEDEEDAE